MNIKAKDFARYESLTVRANNVNLGPLERIPEAMSERIKADIVDKKCGDIISIEINSNDEASYSC